MKKFIYSIIIIISIIFLIKFFTFRSTSPVVFDMDELTLATSSQVVTSLVGELYINKDVWKVEIASTESQKVNGLSNRQILRPKTGMLFVFSESSYQYFWMKDMLIDLDMIFFDENWKIILIERNLSQKTFPQTFGGGVKSKYVLEINAGEADSSGLRLGDQAIFLNE